MLRLVSAGIVAGLVVLGAGPAAGQAPNLPPKFMKHWKDGQAAFHLGEYDKARKHLQAASKMAPQLPGPHRFLALVAQAQKRFDDCLKSAATAVKLNPNSNNAPAIRKVHAACRKELKRPPFRGQFGQGGAIAVISEVDGAVVKLNGLRYGATPMEPRAVATGKVEVSLEKTGYLSSSQSAEVVSGLVTDVVFKLEKDPNYKGGGTITGPRKEVKVGWVTIKSNPSDAAITFDGKPASKDEQGRIEADPGQYTMTVEREGYQPWRRRVRFVKGQNRTIDVSLRSEATAKSLRKKGYMFLGAAAALTASGVIFALMERSKFEEAQDIYDNETARPDLTSSSFIPVKTRDDIADLESSGKKLALISNISYGLAFASLGVSIYYFLKERPAERPGQPLPVAITPILPTNGNSGVGVTATYKTELSW